LERDRGGWAIPDPLPEEKKLRAELQLIHEAIKDETGLSVKDMTEGTLYSDKCWWRVFDGTHLPPRPPLEKLCDKWGLEKDRLIRLWVQASAARQSHRAAASSSPHAATSDAREVGKDTSTEGVSSTDEPGPNPAAQQAPSARLRREGVAINVTAIANQPEQAHPARSGRSGLTITVSVTAIAAILVIGIGFADNLTNRDHTPANASATGPTATPTKSPGPSPTSPSPRRSTVPAQPSIRVTEPTVQPPSPTPSSPPAQAPPTAPPSPAEETAEQPSISFCALSGDCAAKAIFQPDDAYLIACDTKPDYRSGVAVYTRSDVPGERKVWASKTSGTCTGEYLSMPAGATITFKACIGDESEDRLDGCSKEVTATVAKRQ
jgi:hypothetical protein